MTLTVLGAMAGLGLGWSLLRALRQAYGPTELKRLDRAGLDLPVLAYTLGLTLVTGLLLGLAPALTASRRALPRCSRRSRGPGTIPASTGSTKRSRGASARRRRRARRARRAGPRSPSSSSRGAGPLPRRDRRDAARLARAHRAARRARERRLGLRARPRPARRTRPRRRARAVAEARERRPRRARARAARRARGAGRRSRRATAPRPRSTGCAGACATRRELPQLALRAAASRRWRCPATTTGARCVRFLRLENLPGRFPFTAGVFPFKREEEDPTRMFAGEGGPERTNRRFHLLCRGPEGRAPLDRLRQRDALRPRSRRAPRRLRARSAPRASRSARVDDAKKLYSGFDLCAPETSVSMTINGPGADGARLLPERGDRPGGGARTCARRASSTRCARASAATPRCRPTRASCRRATTASASGCSASPATARSTPETYARIRADVLAPRARHGAGRHPEGGPGAEHLHLLDRVRAQADGRRAGVVRRAAASATSTRCRSRATTSPRPGRTRSRSSPSRSPTASPTASTTCRGACRSTPSRRTSRSSSATGSTRSTR